MNITKWKTGSCIKADPNVAEHVFDELASTVGLTPKNLLDASRNEDAPLHKEFEWDDSVAAEKYRENQAGHLIRSIVIESVPEKKEERPVIVRAFMQAGTENYEPIHLIISDESKMAVMLQRALRELQAFRAKYAILKNELPQIFAVIDELERSAS